MPFPEGPDSWQLANESSRRRIAWKRSRHIKWLIVRRMFRAKVLNAVDNALGALEPFEYWLRRTFSGDWSWDSVMRVTAWADPFYDPREESG